MEQASASEPAGVPARRAALRLLDAVIRTGRPLDAALDRATQGLDRPEDRALVRAVAGAVLRRLPDLDALIDGATAKPLPPDAKARMVLRIAIAQALVLGTPPHAAIATVLPLVDGGPRRLVHGVFGGLMRQGAALPEVPALPPLVAERWGAAWGEEAVAAAGRSLAALPPIDLTLRDEADAEGWAARLGGSRVAPWQVRLPAGVSVTGLPGFAEGAWWVQDLAASLPARLLGPGPGRALDLCAAPGGKTMQLAAAGWDVTAVDLSLDRLRRVRENLARTGLNATLVQGDALTFTGEPFDAVLLDAPCSASGIFRRHPEVLHRVRPRAVARFAEQQAAMLARAATLVKPGGTLLYSVCSLEPEEGEDILTTFTKTRIAFPTHPASPDELPLGIAPDANGWVRIRPGTLAEQGGADGFFIARLRRS